MTPAIALPTDAALAELQVALYDRETWSAFDFVEPGAGDSGITWGSKAVGDVDVVVLRGSITFRDWFRDFVALAAPWEHKLLGPVHPGFAIGMDRALAEIRSKTRKDRVIAGHSLGAGRAAILTGLLIQEGEVPLRRVSFGEPKPGFSNLRDFIKTVPVANYRNKDGHHHDLVTDVPLSFPPEEYVHSSDMIDVSASPTAGLIEKWGIFAYHHMPLYASVV